MRKNKILKNQLNQGSEGLCTKNYEILLKEIKANMNGMTFHVHGLEDLTVLKYIYYSKWSADPMKSL